MKADWKDPKKELPVIPEERGSVCVMVSPGMVEAQYPMKAWYNGDAPVFWLADGHIAIVDAWDYYPEHAEPI